MSGVLLIQLFVHKCYTQMSILAFSHLMVCLLQKVSKPNMMVQETNLSFIWSEKNENMIVGCLVY